MPPGPPCRIDAMSGESERSVFDWFHEPLRRQSGVGRSQFIDVPRDELAALLQVSGTYTDGLSISAQCIPNRPTI